MSSPSSQVDMKNPVLIIGLGFGGYTTACNYAKKGVPVVGVDLKDYFYNSVFCIENIADKDGPETVTRRYRDLSKTHPHVHFLHAKCTKYAESTVYLELVNGKGKISLKRNEAGSLKGVDENTLAGNVIKAVSKGVQKIIISSGASRPLACTPSRLLTHYDRDFVPAWNVFVAKIHGASNILTIGAGPIGTEFASFISDVLPGKVHLLHRRTAMMAELGDKASSIIHQQFTNMLGKNLHLGTELKNDEDVKTKRHPEFPSFAFLEAPRDIELTNGDVIKDVDVILFAFTGGEESCEVVSPEHARVDRSLTSINDKNISIIGDACVFDDMGAGDAKMAYLAEMQGKAVFKGGSVSKMDIPGIISPFGTSQGISVFPLPIIGQTYFGVGVTQMILKMKKYNVYRTIDRAFGPQATTS